jgi:hypothetical protein
MIILSIAPVKRVALVVSLALAAVPAVASAQLAFGLAAGVAMPRDELGEGFNRGYQIQGSVMISPSVLPVGFRIDGSYDNFPVTPVFNAPSGGSGVTSGSAAFTGASADLVYGLGGLPVGPYVLGGGGMYHTAIAYNGGTATTSNNPSFNFGAGLKFGIGGLAASVEARYLVVVNGINGRTDVIIGSSGQITQRGTDGARFIPITFGISF